MNRFTPLFLPALMVVPVHAIFASGSDHHSNYIENIPYDSDQMSYLVAPEGVRNRLLDQDPEGEMNGRVLHARRDFNSDGVTDVGVFELKGESLKKLHSSYEVYFGALDDNGAITYPSEVSARVDVNGIPFDLLTEDFDGDGLLDITIMVIDPGPMKFMGMMFSSIFTDSISLDLEFYPQGKDGFTQDPVAVRKVKTISLGKSGEQAAIFPEVLFKDINGDGQADLIVQTGPGQFSYYPAAAADPLFAKKAREYHAAPGTNKIKNRLD